MSTQLFANNGSALLAASINDTDLTIQVATGFGALFPNPGAGEFFEVVLEDNSGNLEIVKIESRTSDLLTVASGGRGQGGTSAQSFTNGVTRVECRLTKAALDRFLQREGDSMSGDLDMNGNEIQDADLTGTGTKIRGGQIIDVPMRGVADDDSNEVRVPTDGTRATAGGAKILVEGDTQFVREAAFEVGMIMDWYGLSANCPAGWAICDGTNGTPDLRGKFVIGAGGTYDLDDTGGSETASGTTGDAGGHTPTGTVEDHTLTEAELPSHKHYIAKNEKASGPQAATSALARETATGGDTEYNLRGASSTSYEADIFKSSPVGGGDPHDHNLTMDAVAAHNHDLSSIGILPPYYALFKIMFVGY